MEQRAKLVELHSQQEESVDSMSQSEMTIQNLNLLLDEKNVQVASLSDKVTHMTLQCSSLESTVSSLKMKECKAEKSRIHAQSLQEQIDLLSREKNDLLLALDDKDMNINSLVEKTNELTKQLSEIQSEREVVEASGSSLSSHIEELQNELAEYKEKLNALDTVIDEKENNNNQLIKDDVLEQKGDTVQTDESETTSEIYVKKADDLQHLEYVSVDRISLEEKEVQISILSATINTSCQELMSITSSLSKSQKNVMNCQKCITCLENKLLEKDKALNDIQNKHEMLFTELESLKDELEQKHSECKDLSMKIQELSRTLKDMEPALTSPIEDKEALKIEVNLMKDLVDEKDREIIRLQTLHYETEYKYKNDIIRKEQEISQLKEKFNQSMELDGDVPNTFDALQKELKHKCDELENMSFKFRQLLQVQGSETEALAVIKQQLQSVLEDNAELNEELKSKEQVLHDQNVHIEMLQEKVAVLEDELKHSAAEQDALRYQYQQFEEDRRKWEIQQSYGMQMQRSGYFRSDQEGYQHGYKDWDDGYNRWKRHVDRSSESSLNESTMGWQEMQQLELQYERSAPRASQSEQDLTKELAVDRSHEMLTSTPLKTSSSETVEVETTPSEVTKLKKLLKKKEARILVMTKQLNEATRKLEEMNKKVEHLEAELIETRKMDQSFTGSESGTEMSATDAQNEVTELKRTIKKKEAKIVVLNKKLLEATEKFKTISDKLHQAEERIEILEAENHNLLEMRSPDVSSNKSGFTETDKDYQKALKIKDAKLVIANKKLTQVTNSVKGMEKRLKLSEETIKTLSEEKNRLELYITDVTNANKELESARVAVNAVQRLTEEKNRLEYNLTEVMISVKELERRLQASEETICEITEEKNKLESEYCDLQRVNANLQWDFDMKFQQLLNENHNLRSQLDASMTSLNEQAQEITSMKKQLEEANICIAQHQDDLQSANEMLDTANVKIQELKRTTENQEEHLINLRFEKEEFLGQIYFLQEQLSASRKTEAHLQGSVEEKADLVNRMATLEHDVSKDKRLLEAAQTTISKLEVVVNKKDSELIAKNKKMGELTEFTNQLNEKVSFLQQENENLRSVKSDLEHRLNESITMYQQVPASNSEKDFQINNLSDQLQDYYTQITYLQADVKTALDQSEDLKDQNLRLHSENENMLLKISSLEEELAQRANELTASHVQTVLLDSNLGFKLQEATREKEQLVTQFESDKAELNNQIAFLQQQVQQNEQYFQSQLQVKDQAIRELDKSVNDSMTENRNFENLQEKVQDNERIIKALQEDVDTKLLEINEKEQNVQTLNTDISELQKQVLVLQKDNENLNNEIHTVKEQNTEYWTQVLQLQEVVESANSASSSLEAQNQSSMSKLELLKGNSSHCEKLISELKNEVASLQKKVTKKEAKAAGLNKDLTKLKADFELVSGKLEASEMMVKKLSSENEQLTVELDSVKITKGRLKEMINQMKEDKIMQTELKQIDIDTLHTSLHSLQNEVQQKCDAVLQLEKMVEELQLQISENILVIQREMQSKESLEQVIAEMETENVSTVNELQDVINQITLNTKNKSEEISHLQKQCEHLSEELKKEQEYRSNAESIIREKETAIESCQKDIDSLSESLRVRESICQQYETSSEPMHESHRNITESGLDTSTSSQVPLTQEVFEGSVVVDRVVPLGSLTSGPNGDEPQLADPADRDDAVHRDMLDGRGVNMKDSLLLEKHIEELQAKLNEQECLFEQQRKEHVRVLSLLEGLENQDKEKNEQVRLREEEMES